MSSRNLILPKDVELGKFDLALVVLGYLLIERVETVAPGAVFMPEIDRHVSSQNEVGIRGPNRVGGMRNLMTTVKGNAQDQAERMVRGQLAPKSRACMSPEVGPFRKL